ncbi:MAG: VWA domain-containing protein [Anaerolineae bacterium]|nr:VWA domain-containing protein [Anaerolineae bacterium]MDW8298992.1 VWA domain-containing protein [Anaerolineae bacterium]
MSDLYAVLGVSPEAFEDDIRRAYRAAARRLHPDVNPHRGAASQFREITAAYEVLGDAVERARYDQKRRQQPPENQYFTLKVTPSSRIVPVLSEPQVLYLLVELVPDFSLTATNAHLNLTLVIDHSTSMNGLRLERTKVAAHRLIDQLTANDVLSVIAFSDRAEVLVQAAPLTDKNAAKAMITTLQASGSTEIYQGLQAAYEQNRRYASKNFANHIILITDGRTYGDEEDSLALAQRCVAEGIGISAMGIGEEWNDAFLDRLASTTGGTSHYINSPNVVQRFLEERLRLLGQAIVERVTLSLAPDPDVTVENAFRLSPSAQPLSHESDPLMIGQILPRLSTSVILTLQLPPIPQPGFRSLIRLAASGDVLWNNRGAYQAVADISIEAMVKPPAEERPMVILDALSKLSLYRIQQKAAEAAARGDIREATRKLETVATRLLESGQTELANVAMAEARRLSSTRTLSEEVHKALKYGTRRLLLPSGE